jgi:hypothetical protein
MFVAIFNNDCCPSVCYTIGMLCVVYWVVRNFDITFLSEMCFRNQHDIYFLILYVDFDFFSMLDEPVSFP